MNMDKNKAASTLATATATATGMLMSMPSSTSLPSHGAHTLNMDSDSMTSMSSTFSINTRVTLFFTEWTTTTPATYVLAIFFLFFLGLLNRFLGAWKSQLERRWREDGRERLEGLGLGLEKGRGTAVATGRRRSREGAVKRGVDDATDTGGGIKGHVRKWSQALRPRDARLDIQIKDEESEPLSPAPVGSGVADPDIDCCSNMDIDEETVVAGNGKESRRASGSWNRGKRRFWVASSKWSLKRDGIRGWMEFVRALIGYILMLAVMTYNVGFLFAVTGSVLLGEIVFGRYTQSGSGWQEGGCHE